jgi:pyruvate kinase
MGPACADEKVLRDMIKSGMTVARLNFSHGSHEYHMKQANLIRKVSNELGLDIGILVNFSGQRV